MLLIFILSAQTADESSTLSGGICYELCRIFVRGFENMDLAMQMEMTESMQGIVRAAAHFVEYGVLGLLLSLTFKSFGMKSFALYSVITGTIYAASDEIHQLFVPGRAFEFTDILVDGIGVAAGALILLLSARINRRRYTSGCL